MAAFVERLPNAIGYVEYSSAKTNRMSHVLMRNAAGGFVAPNDVTFKAAAAGAAWDKSFYRILTEQPGKDAWPIAVATFIPMHRAQDKPAQASSSSRFFDWALTNGDKMAAELECVALPDSVKALVRRAWGEAKDLSGKVVSYK